MFHHSDLTHNTFLQAAPDPMHTLPLGVSRHMIQATVWVIKDYLMSLHKWQAGPAGGEPQSFFGPKDVHSVITRLCDRFHIIQRTCHGMDLTDWMCQELYRVYEGITQNKHNMQASLRAHEYLIFSMLMPYVLNDILQEEIQLYSDYIDNLDAEASTHFFENAQAKIASDPVPHMTKAWHMYMRFFCILRQTRMSQSQLDEAQIMARDVQAELWHAFPTKGGQKHGWHFPKIHHMYKLIFAKMLFGSLDCISTQATEHTHVFFSGKQFSLTNRKGDVSKQIMYRLTTQQVVRDLATLFNGAHGIHLEQQYRKFQYSKSQIYSFPVQLLFLEHRKVSRTLASPLRCKDTDTRARHTPLGTFAKTKHAQTSKSGTDADASPWHPGFMYLPYLIGQYLWKNWRWQLDMPEWDNVSHPGTQHHVMHAIMLACLLFDSVLILPASTIHKEVQARTLHS